MDVEGYFRSFNFTLHQFLQDGMIGYLNIEYRNSGMHFDVEEGLSHIPITAYMNIPDIDEVAEYLRDNPPEEIEQSMFNNYLDIVEAPWPRRDENQLRKVYKEEYNNKSSRTSALIEVIKNSGIEPLIIKDPLDPIELDDVHLLCWLGIEKINA